MTGGDRQASEALADFVIATYREIADRFGLGSPDAARVRAKRSGWEREPTNHPLDPARVRVPLSAWEQPVARPASRYIIPSYKPRTTALRSKGAVPNNDPPNNPLGSDPPNSFYGALADGALYGALADSALALLQDQLKRERQRADAAEKAAQEERQRADQRAVELAELRERTARAEGEAAALKSAVAHEQAQVAQERAARQAAEVERNAARDELAGWTAGGPLVRVWRAFLNRRGR